MSNNLEGGKTEEDIRFYFVNHILDQDLISNCRLLDLRRDYQDFVEAFYRYITIDTNCEVWYLDFHNQSSQRHFITANSLEQPDFISRRILPRVTADSYLAAKYR
jgi:hypothetical protein